ncbi:MAG: (d)CMP kinase [Syntrophomonas sp.]
MKIAIDGPAGAGKSTLAKEVSRKLGYIYIDTGAMYRSLTWKALQNGIDLEDAQALWELARNTRIHFLNDSVKQKVICDNMDVTEEIRSPQVSGAVSRVAAYPEVRKIMVQQQQEMGRSVSVVMDGRDIGECVLPDAEYKFFLTANREERARRRTEELRVQGYNVVPELIEKDMLQRDKDDATREIGALKILDDSIVIDTTNLTIEQVLQKILSIIQED